MKRKLFSECEKDHQEQLIDTVSNLQNISFSSHALERLADREIKKESVLEVIKKGFIHTTTLRRSKGKNERLLSLWFNGLYVIINKKGKVITTHKKRMKKEISEECKNIMNIVLENRRMI